MSIPILMEIVFFLGCCTWCCTYYAHSSNPDTKCTRMPHLLSDQPAQKKRDRSGREMAPQQWHQHPVKKLRLFWPLKARQDPKQKQRRKYLRSGGIELLSTHGTRWRKLKSDASSGWPQEPGLRRGAFAKLHKECGRQSQRGGNSYRRVIGFCRQRLLWRCGCMECPSWLLSCGERRFPGREQGTGKKS